MKIVILAVCSIATVAFSQTQLTHLQESLGHYKAERAEYTKRIEALVVQLKKMDADIERSIKQTLEFSQRYTDSAETRERIMKSKQSIQKDLIRSTQRYLDLQKDFTREIATERDYLKEDVIRLHDWATEKINVRVKQITEITTSLGGYDFYSTGIGYREDNYDYERQQQLAENAAENKKDMVLKMRKGIEELKKQREALQKDLADVRSQRSVENINTELDGVNDKIILLENSIEEIFSAEARGKRVGKTESRAIEKELRNRVNEIKSNADSFFENFDALLRMLRMQKNLSINIEKYEFAIEQLSAE